MTIKIVSQQRLTKAHWSGCRECGDATRIRIARYWSDGSRDVIAVCEGHAAATTMHDTA